MKGNINIKLDQAEEGSFELKDTSFEITQSKKSKEKRVKRMRKALVNYRYCQMKQFMHYWNSRRREGERSRKLIQRDNGSKIPKSGKRFGHPSL